MSKTSPSWSTAWRPTRFLRLASRARLAAQLTCSGQAAARYVRRIPFLFNNLLDLATATAVIAGAGSAVGLFDKVADQVVRFIRKTPEPPGPPKEFQLKVTGKGSKLKVESLTVALFTFFAEDLEHLPPDYYGHIQTLEASVQTILRRLEQVYPHRDDGDLITNAKLNNQSRDLSLKMKDDLAGIVDFLQSIGVHLDDHYMIYVMSSVDTPVTSLRTVSQSDAPIFLKHRSS